MSENIFWQNAAMTEPLELANAMSRIGVSFQNGIETGQLMFYVGHPDVLSKIIPALESTATDIKLTPTNAMGVWQASKQYAYGQLVAPTTHNGLMYKCIKTGISGANEPVWPTNRAAEVSDGGSRWVCIGPRFNPSDIKLAKSAAGLDAATGGSALSLGAELICGPGTATAIHVRIHNPSAVVRSDEANPGVVLRLNPCEFAENL